MTTNALTFIYMTRGIPMVYYGTEAGMRGAKDPENRGSYIMGNIPSGFTSRVVRELNRVRKDHKTYSQDAEIIYSDKEVLVIHKSPDVLAVMTNDIESVTQARVIKDHPFLPGDELCN